MLTWRSAIASSSADCTLAGARLISSASTRLAKTGPSSVSNRSVDGPPHLGADDVGRHQVRRELQPGEAAADDVGQGPDRQRLGHAGHALEQDVPAGQQADQHPLDHQVLADDDPLHLEQGPLQHGGGISRTVSSSVITESPSCVGPRSLRRRPGRRAPSLVAAVAGSRRRRRRSA